MKLLTYLLLAVFILAFSTAASSPGEAEYHKNWNPFEIDGQAEPILGVIFGEKGLEFQVHSTGCTEKDDFVVQRLSPESQTTSQLLLIRVKPDYCDAYVPYGTWISFTYQELQLEVDDRFTVLNPLSSFRVEHFD